MSGEPAGPVRGGDSGDFISEAPVGQVVTWPSRDGFDAGNFGGVINVINRRPLRRRKVSFGLSNSLFRIPILYSLLYLTLRIGRGSPLPPHVPDPSGALHVWAQGEAFVPLARVWRAIVAKRYQINTPPGEKIERTTLSPGPGPGNGSVATQAQQEQYTVHRHRHRLRQGHNRIILDEQYSARLQP